jgi:hypothetical protein
MDMANIKPLWYDKYMGLNQRKQNDLLYNIVFICIPNEETAFSNAFICRVL